MLFYIAFLPFFIIIIEIESDSSTSGVATCKLLYYIVLGSKCLEQLANRENKLV